MASLRQRKWFKCTVFLAAVALLWSQFALANHGGCLDMLAHATSVEVTHGHGCDGMVPSADKAQCDAHCAAGEVNADSGRIPPVPPLFVGAWLPWFPTVAIVDGVPVATSSWLPPPPKPAWHRPTPHPAALLLI